jgi:predicted RNA-binding protein Jag
MKRVYEGKTRSEAITKACAELNVTREELHFEVVATEGKGLFRRVRIRVLGIDKREGSDGQE